MFIKKIKFYIFLIIFSFLSSVLFALPPCEPGYIKDNCFGKEIWANNNGYYIGEWKNNKMHGYGKNFWQSGSKNSGDRYEGYWEDNLRHGEGTYYYSNGLKFSGKWIRGKRYYGTQTYLSGDKYHGYWHNNKWDGEGAYTYKNGKVVRGQFKDGKLVSQGSSQNSNNYAQNNQKRNYAKRNYVDPRKNNNNQSSNKSATNHNFIRLADYIGFLTQCYEIREGYQSIYITIGELKRAKRKANYLIQNSSLPGNKNELISKFHNSMVPEQIEKFNQSLGALMFMNSNWNPEMRQECQQMNFVVKMSKSLSDFK